MDQDERSRTVENRFIYCLFIRRVLVNRTQGFDIVMESWLDHRVCPLGGIPRCSHPPITSLNEGET